MTVTELLREIKKEFNNRKDEGCVLIDRLSARYGVSYEKGGMDADAKVFKEVAKQLEHAKGVYKVIPTEVSYGGGFSSKRIIIRLRLLRKPCKEFLQLNNYLQKYTSVNPLKWNDVKKEIVSGKRDSYDIEGEKLLMHDSKVCGDILLWLRKNKATTFNLTTSVRVESYKSSGYREEREWNGYFDYYLLIELYTRKTNKLKTRATFHID